MPSSPPNVSWLRISSQNIYDSNNVQVKLYACVIQDGDGHHITQTDITNIHNMGFNAIRLFIEWGTVQPTANSIDIMYFTQASGASSTIDSGVDYIINWAVALGMYVIICPVWTETWGPPAWATGVSATSGDASSFFYNSQVQSGVYYLYNWMGQHYASNCNVIFESFNEISTTTDSDASAFAAFNNGWVSAIESGEGGNSHLKIVELLYHWGDAYNYVLSTPFISGSHANVLLATHDYPLVDSASNVALSFAQTWSNTIHNAGYPWIDTEFSTAVNNAQSPPGYTGLSYAVSLMAQYNIAGWAYFCYDSGSNQESTWNINNPINTASILSALGFSSPSPTATPIPTPSPTATPTPTPTPKPTSTPTSGSLPTQTPYNGGGGSSFVRLSTVAPSTKQPDQSKIGNLFLFLAVGACAYLFIGRGGRKR